MSIVYIVAPAPWGPIKLGAATDMGDLLDQVTTAPAHVEDCGTLDATRVAEVARALLPTPDGLGWIAVCVEEACRKLTEARQLVLARVVAEAAKAAPGPPVSHGAVNRHNMEAIAPRQVSRRRRASTTRVTADDGGGDVRAIRAGLKMTQAEFARAWGFSLAAVRDWEQGRVAPEPATRALLAVIGYNPDVVRKVLAQYG